MTELKKYVDYAEHLRAYWDREDHPGDVGFLNELSKAADTIEELVSELRTLKGDTK
jgi:hypothetical protein